MCRFGLHEFRGERVCARQPAGEIPRWSVDYFGGPPPCAGEPVPEFRRINETSVRQPEPESASGSADPRTLSARKRIRPEHRCVAPAESRTRHRQRDREDERRERHKRRGSPADRFAVLPMIRSAAVDPIHGQIVGDAPRVEGRLRRARISREVDALISADCSAVRGADLVPLRL
jgi:hypothetical protein